MTAMTVILWYITPLAALLHITGSAAQCAYPGEVSAATVVAETSQTTYDTDAMILYECDERGRGHVSRFCQADGTWGEMSRSCADSIVWESGGMAGVIVAGINYFIAIVAVVYSRCTFPAPPQDDDDKDKDKDKDQDQDTDKKDKKDKTDKNDKETSKENGKKTITSNGTK